MTPVTLRGLTWSHRRAVDPLIAAARAFAETAPDVSIEWDDQPLAGFEHGLSGTLADRYDMVVFDHPFCGAIARERLFAPLDRPLAALPDHRFVGQSLSSYRYREELWALPIDAATQVAAYRLDLLGRYGSPPKSWTEVIALGRAVRGDGVYLGLPMLCPHAFMTTMALCANLGRPFSDEPDQPPFDRLTLSTAMALLREIAGLVHPACFRFNPIHLYEHMMEQDDIVYVPVVYGYLTYAEADQRRPLRFADFPGPAAPYAAGTVLGGTGLGITRCCRHPAIAYRFLEFLSDPAIQTSIIGTNHGQPAAAAAWSDHMLDTRFSGAFSGTQVTIENAWVRPRFAGYIAFQDNAGRLVASHLAGELSETELIRRLETAWRATSAVATTSRRHAEARSDP